jgi:hypothetical protein
MGPLNRFPPELLLNVLASRDHIHNVDKLMDPLDSRDILRSLASFTKRNVFLGILSALILVGQFEINYGLESNLYQLSYLCPTSNIHAMCHPPPHKCPLI